MVFPLMMHLPVNQQLNQK